MIDIDKMKFDDVVYLVVPKYNISRVKLTMVDSSGVEWYRYNKPSVECSIQKQVYCGKKYEIYEGVVDADYCNPQPVYFFECNGIITTWNSDEQTYIFPSHEQAEQFSEQFLRLNDR